jgi:hypothetical protein
VHLERLLDDVEIDYGESGVAAIRSSDVMPVPAKLEAEERLKEVAAQAILPADKRMSRVAILAMIKDVGHVLSSVRQSVGDFFRSV